MAVDWEVRGFGEGATIVARCRECKGIFEIERPSPTVQIKHCGNRTRIPERTYERWCEARDHGKPDWRQPNVRFIYH